MVLSILFNPEKVISFVESRFKWHALRVVLKCDISRVEPGEGGIVFGGEIDGGENGPSKGRGRARHAGSC